MKICILNNEGMPYDTIPSHGGVQYVTQYLSEKLADNGCEVHILTRSKSGKTNNVQREDGIWVHYNAFGSNMYFFGKRNKITAVLLLLLSPIYNMITFNTLRKLNPDVVHCQNHQQILAAYLLKLIKKTPYVVTKHGSGEFGLFGKPFTPQLEKIWYKFPYIKNTNEYICLTTTEKNDFDKLFGANSLVIPNGVDTERFYPLNRDKVNDNKSYSLLCVSRLVSGKGLESLILSMKKILSKYPLTKLSIVGQGPLLDELIILSETLGIGDSVVFEGSVSDVNLNYNNCHVYIMPSPCESFSLTVLEAAACGLPIISTTVGVAPEFINEWKNGVLVEPDNPDSIADAVIDLFSNKDKLKEFSNNSLKARDAISWDSIAKRYIELYEEMCREE